MTPAAFSDLCILNRYDEYEVLGGESEFKKDFDKWAEFRNPYMDQDK